MNKVERLSKFPLFLRTAFIERNIDFPLGTEFTYSPTTAYRCVNREKDDNSGVSKKDLLSYFEENKTPCKIHKGLNNNVKDDPCYYGVSFSFNKEKIIRNLKNNYPAMKILVGTLIQENGPIYINKKTEHVCCWFYSDANIDKFSIED